LKGTRSLRKGGDTTDQGATSGGDTQYDTPCSVGLKQTSRGEDTMVSYPFRTVDEGAEIPVASSRLGLGSTRKSGKKLEKIKAQREIGKRGAMKKTRKKN